MKVVHVAHGYPPECTGGIESYLSLLLPAQSADGVEVALLAGSHAPWPEVGVAEESVEGVRVLRLHRDDAWFDHYARAYHPGVERLVAELLERERPDLVHVHQWIRLTSNLVEVAARAGVPAVVTLHDLYTSCPRCFRVRPDGEACFREPTPANCLDCVQRFGHESEEEVARGIELHVDQYRCELRQAAHVLVADGSTRDLIAEALGLQPTDLRLLPLPYEPRFAGAEPAPLPADAEPFRFAYWGNVTRRKGTQVLVRAFADLCAEGLPRPAELHLFGGIDTPELERELLGLAAGWPVRFHGRYAYEELAGAGVHMGAFPMQCFETYGFVLDECFELGLPCIVTDIGAMSARAGGAALRVPPDDAEALRDALRRVLERPALRDELQRWIPETSPSSAEHRERLAGVYAEAVADGVPSATGLPAERRAELQRLQAASIRERGEPQSAPS